MPKKATFSTGRVNVHQVNVDVAPVKTDVSIFLLGLAANPCPKYSEIKSIHSKHEVEHLQVYQDRECVRNWQLYFYPSLSCEAFAFESKVALDHFEVSVGSTSKVSSELSGS